MPQTVGRKRFALPPWLGSTAPLSVLKAPVPQRPTAEATTTKKNKTILAETAEMDADTAGTAAVYDGAGAGAFRCEFCRNERRGVHSSPPEKRRERGGEGGTAVGRYMEDALPL